MSRRTPLAALALAALAGLAGSSEPARAAEAPPAKEDILAQAKAWNAKPNPPPPTTFRDGNVTPRQLPPTALSSKAAGFELSLPSGAPVTTPTVYAGKVYTSGGFHSREFYALDAKSGKPVWGLDLDDDGPSTAACASGRCAFNTESCTLFTVDAESGKLLWSHYLGDPLTSSPTIADGKVFTSYPAPGHPSASHVLAAFDLETGKILWQRWIDSDVQSAPVISGGKLRVATFGGALYELTPGDGSLVSAERARATSAPTVAGNGIVYSQRSDAHGEAAAEALAARVAGQKEVVMRSKTAVYLDEKVQGESEFAAKAKLLDAGNGFAGGAPSSANAQAAQGNVGKGSVASMQSHQGSRVVAYTDGVVAAMGDEVVCTDPADGKVLWSRKIDGDMRKVGGALVTSPAAAGDSLFVGTVGGEVLRLDPKTGEVRQRWTVGGPVRSQPVIEAGWIYVGTENGRVVGIDTKNPSFTGWATWGGDMQRSSVVGHAR
ncbi:MAG: PQQ-binding-like beta-propeller repeat protein [Myxococcota bacterium]